MYGSSLGACHRCNRSIDGDSFFSSEGRIHMTCMTVQELIVQWRRAREDADRNARERDLFAAMTPRPIRFPWFPVILGSFAMGIGVFLLALHCK